MLWGFLQGGEHPLCVVYMLIVGIKKKKKEIAGFDVVVVACLYLRHLSIKFRHCTSELSIKRFE